MSNRSTTLTLVLFALGFLALLLPEQFHSLYFLCWGCACFVVAYDRRKSRRAATEGSEAPPNSSRERLLSFILIGGGISFLILSVSHVVLQILR